MMERSISVTFDNTDLQAIAMLLDAGVKALGLQSVKQAATLLNKLEAAVAAANTAPDMEKP